jgi:hypothetical protein
MSSKILSAGLAFIAFVFPWIGQAGSQADLAHQADVADQGDCKTRPLSDFLDAQGGPVQFFPPVEDYVGWFDAPFVNFALVDYAGLANDYIEEGAGESLGTTSSGSV